MEAEKFNDIGSDIGTGFTVKFLFQRNPLNYTIVTP